MLATRVAAGGLVGGGAYLILSATVRRSKTHSSRLALPFAFGEAAMLGFEDVADAESSEMLHSLEAAFINARVLSSARGRLGANVCNISSGHPRPRASSGSWRGRRARTRCPL